MVQVSLEYKAYVSVETDSGETPLHLASRSKSMRRTAPTSPLIFLLPYHPTCLLSHNGVSLVVCGPRSSPVTEDPHDMLLSSTVF